MRAKSFIHSQGEQHTTIGRLIDAHERVQSTQMLSCFAYATNSGAAYFDLKLGHNIWPVVETRWLFGIDYGRTDPSALRLIAGKQNSQVRIYDGAFVTGSASFLPRKDFHMKAAFFLNEADDRFGMVAGSGNFSAGGLVRNIECGTTLVATSQLEFQRSFQLSHIAAIELWNNSAPLELVIDDYEDRWRALRGAEEEEEEEDVQCAAFWIEAGYVTRNRGPFQPGNQIDMPRGMHRLFGLEQPVGAGPNTIIGPVTFLPPSGVPVTRNLRLGNNMMEKISLPIPEDHGLEIYDGKVLVFQEVGEGFSIVALEADDFQQAFGSRLRGIRLMGSGRRYGLVDE
ncbi:hypothetical protein [Sinorhizobium fredii]|uniref:Phospholipase D-like domain-containing protein n=1 Tax=Rhizobium fredii TaxID=380 RepID=A0A2L0H9J7_RHIFR|nr:hypothetical protein [Sinorhizobium fredii]AUX78124.1 hypothetical protein NXT3_CH03598 [Sinorhizobium fredii]